MSEAVASPFSNEFTPSAPSALTGFLRAGIEKVGGSSGVLGGALKTNKSARAFDAQSASEPWQSGPVGEEESNPPHSRLLSGVKPASWEAKRMSEEVNEIEGSGHAEDERLVQRAQKGDGAAFDQLVGKHTSRLYGLIYHMTGNHEDTNDLLQDVWTKVFRSLAGFRGASRFTTWIHSIAVNMSINFLKRRSRRQTVSIDVGGDEGGALDAVETLLVSPHTPRSEAGIAELQGRLSEALGRLSNDHRAVVTMFDIQGMAHAEIGKILGVSEGTVRSRLFYAHRQLQAFLSDLHMEGAVV
jgi:RNA polymerase sigma factor (sigma-70 family)